MKCANCGSDMRYDVSVMGLVCDYCGAVKNLPKPEDEQLIVDMDFGTAIRGAATDWGVSRRPVECKSCGAQMFYSPDQMSGICPYCGSSVVVSGEEADLGMAPNAIIPFSMENRVTPRYIAPLSRYRNPNSFATIFAKVLLPVAEKPSTAMMMSGTFIIFQGSVLQM